MNNFFDYDNITGTVTLNGPDLLLIKEFADLMDPKRNKSKQDPKGQHKDKAFRELKYIYLALHWNSPYADYEPNDRHEAALVDAMLTEEEWNDPTFREACRKFQRLQDSNRSIRLLEAARDTVDKITDYFNNLDPEERDVQTGKPIFQVKNIIAEMTSLNKVHDTLVTLEGQVKKEISETSTIRAGAEDGFLPNF